MNSNCNNQICFNCINKDTDTLPCCFCKHGIGNHYGCISYYIKSSKNIENKEENND